MENEMKDVAYISDFDVMMNLRRLRHLRRCNTLPTVLSEDVAQHSFFVAQMAMAIGDEYNTYATEHNVGYHPNSDKTIPELNMEKVLRKSLCHDIEEAFVSDIPWNIKHMDDDTHAMFEKTIKTHMDKIFDGTNVFQLQKFLNSTCKDGLEGKLVNIVDMLELALFSWEEYNLGNQSMKGMLDKSIRLINSFEFSKELLQASPLFKKTMEKLKYNRSYSGFQYIYHIS